MTRLALSKMTPNRLPKGESLPNAFTLNAMMVAVESGDEKAGTCGEVSQMLFAEIMKIRYREIEGRFKFPKYLPGSHWNNRSLILV